MPFGRGTIDRDQKSWRGSGGRVGGEVGGGAEIFRKTDNGGWSGGGRGGVEEGAGGGVRRYTCFGVQRVACYQGLRRGSRRGSKGGGVGGGA